MSLAALLHRLGRRGPEGDPQSGWVPDRVASFVPWPKQKPDHMQELFAPTKFVPTRYERFGANSDVFALYISPSFGTGYSYQAFGTEEQVDRLALRLEGAEDEDRPTTIEEFIAIADGITQKATGAGIPDNTVTAMRDRKRATLDYSTKGREIGLTGHGFNFSDFAAVAHEPHYRAFLYEVFAPDLAKKW